MELREFLGYFITIIALIVVPVVGYKLLRTPPKNAGADAEAEPTIGSYDLPFVEQIMELVWQHESTRIQPHLRIIDADNYVVETINSSGGRNPMPFSETHDLRTRDGLGSFETSCMYGLMQALFFLAGTNPEERASIYMSKSPNEFHRGDLEPWISIIDIIRKRHGFI